MFYNNIVFGNLGRIAPKRPKRVIKNRRAIDLPRMMADSHLRINFQEAIAAKLASRVPGTSTRNADGMTLEHVERLLLNAADTAPPIRRNKYRGAGVQPRRRKRS